MPCDRSDRRCGLAREHQASAAFRWREELNRKYPQDIRLASRKKKSRSERTKTELAESNKMCSEIESRRRKYKWDKI
jgi:hypothetical protein